MVMIKSSKYAGREEFAEAWSRVTRRVHLQLLAKPAPRRLVPDPNPLFYRPFPMQIDKATLQHQASKRLKLLSQVPPDKYTEKYVHPTKPEHYVSELNFNYVPSQRIEELSQPRSLLRKDKKKKQCRKGLRKSGIKKKQQQIKKKPLLEARKEWLDMRAVPRKPPLPPPIPKYVRRTKPLTPEEREERIRALALPTPRFTEKPPEWNPYEVSRKAQHAVPSKRLKELAEPRDLPEEAQLDLAFKPFAIKKAALKYRASKRINALAEPVEKKKAVNNDLRGEEAFTIPKRALRAKCTKRTKELARPVTRRGLD